MKMNERNKNWEEIELKNIIFEINIYSIFYVFENNM